MSLGNGSANGRRQVWLRSGMVLAVALASVGGMGASCNDEAERTFRAAASDALEAGVMSLLEGVTTGAFAVFDLGTENNGNPTEVDTGGTTETTTETTTAQSAP